MTRPLVYLAGAIAGLSGSDATIWRHVACLRLVDRGIETLDPMRAKAALAAQARISTNFNDVRRCDALLVNLLGLAKPSCGTIMELAWAYALQKPAVVAIEAEGNPHDNHPMIHEAMPFRVTTLEDAVDAVAVILNR